MESPFVYRKNRSTIRILVQFYKIKLKSIDQLLVIIFFFLELDQSNNLECDIAALDAKMLSFLSKTFLCLNSIK